jgi:hypothetical protein
MGPALLAYETLSALALVIEHHIARALPDVCSNRRQRHFWRNKLEREK